MGQLGPRIQQGKVLSTQCGTTMLDGPHGCEPTLPTSGLPCATLTRRPNKVNMFSE